MNLNTAFEIGQPAVFRIKNLMGHRVKSERHNPDIALGCPATLIVAGRADVGWINPCVKQGKSS